MNSPTSQAAPVLFKDQRRLLTLVGAFEILISAFVVWRVVRFLALTSDLASLQEKLPGVGIFVAVLGGTIALFFFAAGVGTIRAKNWARITMLIVSWAWLPIGLLSLTVIAVAAPTAMRNAAAHGVGAIFILVRFLAGAVLGYLLLPIAFILIYSNKNVRLTCRAQR